MNRHYFGSTGEAYDACQCSDKVKDGDILIVTSERVIGIADTWPLAITPATGVLHGTAPFMTMQEVAAHADLPVESFIAAHALAKELGFDVQAPIITVRIDGNGFRLTGGTLEGCAVNRDGSYGLNDDDWYEVSDTGTSVTLAHAMLTVQVSA